MTYRDTEIAGAVVWKRTSQHLPDAARVAAPYSGGRLARRRATYEHCLPPEFAQLNLLPAVRQQALDLFAELGIPWHAGVAGGPSNNLLSSQVQCVNALGAMVTDPERIVRAFGELLDIDEVLPIEPGRWLTFEYIGPEDWFGECPGGDRVRGARCTSVDAAFRHRARDGVVELVLIEWKYTESYRLRVPEPEKDVVRRERYATALDDPDGPVRADVLAIEHLFDEPLYQLVRQQLLAHALERAGAEGVGRVWVVHVAPSGNDAYQSSLHRREHLAVGATVAEVWQRLLRRPDRFTSIDSALFLDPAVTSRDYALRYGDAIRDESELLAAVGVDDRGALEDALDFDGDLHLREEGVELVVGCEGWMVEYPFVLSELHAAITEVERQTVWDAIETGDLVIEMRDGVPHVVTAPA